MELQRLNKKVKIMWGLTRAVTFLIVTAAWFFIAIGSGNVICYIIAGVVALIGIITVIVYPALEYIQWSYRITDEIIEIKKGIFFKTHNIIPVLRIQNSDTYQGPVARLFGLSTLCINTAGGVFKIEGIEMEKAEEISKGLKNVISKNNGEGK